MDKPQTIELPMSDSVRELLQAKGIEDVLLFGTRMIALLAVLAWSLTHGGGFGPIEVGCLALAGGVVVGFVRGRAMHTQDIGAPLIRRTIGLGQISREDSRHGTAYYLDVDAVRLTIEHPNRLDRSVRRIVDKAPRTLLILGNKEIVYKDRLLSADYTLSGEFLLELRDASGAVIYRHPEYLPDQAEATSAFGWKGRRARGKVRLISGVLLFLVPSVLAAWLGARMLSSFDWFRHDAYSFWASAIILGLLAVAWFGSIKLALRFWRTRPVVAWLGVVCLSALMVWVYQPVFSAFP
jgi:hypothetical protein